MAQITRNTAIDIKRLKSFENENKSESLNPAVHRGETSQFDTDKMDVDKLIAGMDEKYAFVLEYLYLKGYSQSELSDEFEIPIGTIKTRVKKAIKILRTKLKDEKKFIIGFFTLILLILIIFK
jgi:RNA polymerase sigma-70 factor (ECF subfamily)